MVEIVLTVRESLLSKRRRPVWLQPREGGYKQTTNSHTNRA